jgi:hypothetical protein
VGGALGGITGAFFHKSLHLTKEEIEQLGTELDAGRVAVVVTCDDVEVGPTSQQLTSSGGTVRSYAVPTEALEETAAAIEAAPEALKEAGVEMTSAEAAPTDTASSGETSTPPAAA